jgi:uncharacterized protein
MRKGEREIKDRSEIDAVMRKSRVCRLGLTDGHEPYVVPLCFGYDGKALYFHCAPEGRKIDLLLRNNKVCFEVDWLEEIIEHKQACRWGARFESVIGSGTATFLETPEEKRRGLEILMKQYSPMDFTFPDDILSHTMVIRIDIESISGKHGRL